jgi:hypothetical protein
MDMSGHSKKKTEDSSLIIPEKVKPLYKNGKSDFIGDVFGDVYPILYLSGSSGAHGITEEKLTEVADSRFRCFSFAYTGKASPVYAKAQAKAMDYCMRHGHRVFLDSGAHTFHNFRYKQKGGALVRHLTKAERNAALGKMTEDFVLGYAAYVRECYARGYKFDFYVTFDAEKRCALIRKMTDQLFELGIHPVPAYHGDASLDWLRRYIDEGHKIIGVGTSRAGKHNQTDIRRYYATVIDLCEKHKVKCHGFAITGDSMFQFPWFSVDSTTWLKSAAYGKIIEVVPERQRVSLVHISTRHTQQGYGVIENLSPEVQKGLRNRVEKQGFDFEELRTNLGYRALYNARQYVIAVRVNAKKPLRFASWKSVL